MLRQQLGDIVIDRIVESEEPNFDPLVFFPQSRAEDWLAHKGWMHREPSWGSLADFDAALAGRTRRAFLERCCGTGMLVCGTHFPSPSFGRVVPHADAFHFAYEAA